MWCFWWKNWHRGDFFFPNSSGLLCLCTSVSIPFAFIHLSQMLCSCSYWTASLNKKFVWMEMQRISPDPRLRESFRNVVIFYAKESLTPLPTPPTGGPPCVGCPRLLIQYICSSPPYWKPSAPSATWERTMPWWQWLSRITYRTFGVHKTWISWLAEEVQ